MATGNDPPPADADLGAPIDVFKPMAANVAAGFVLAGLLVVAGAAAVWFPLWGAYRAGWNLPLNAEKDWSWLTVVLFAVIGVLALWMAAAFAQFARGLIAHRVEVYADGFRHHTRGGVEAVRWADVAGVRETILYERPPVLKGAARLLIPKVASTSYAVATRAGKVYEFDGNAVKAIRRFGRVLRAQADRLALPWETVEEHA
jgi:hypothetical protein